VDGESVVVVGVCKPVSADEGTDHIGLELRER
jgi:hypothetical protein